MNDIKKNYHPSKQLTTLFNNNNNNNISGFLYSAQVNIITPGYWALNHSFNHLSSLGSIQPVLTNMQHTKLINQRTIAALAGTQLPLVGEKLNVKCRSRTQVSRPGFKPTLCCTKTPELKSISLIRSATTPHIQITCLTYLKCCLT